MQDINKLRNDSGIPKGFYRKLVKIALPIAVQGIISSSLGLVDNIMVGSLGEEALAAVGIAMQIFFVQYLFVFGFVSGCGTFVAQFYGAGDKKGVHKTLGFAITVSLLIGLIFFVAAFFFPEKVISLYTDDISVVPLARTYMRTGSWTILFLGFSIPIEASLRGTQQTTLPLYVSSFVFSLNTILNYFLIYGKFGFPHLGVYGAAIATVIARFLEMFILLIVIRKGNYLTGKLPEYFDWNKLFLKRVINNAKSTTGNELFWSLGQTVYVAAFARLGVTAYASFQAANNINNVFIFAGYSLGDATLIILGEYLGRRENELAEKISKKILKIGTIIGIISAFGLYFIGRWMLQLFELTELGRIYSERLLLVMAIIMAIKVYCTILVIGILRAGGDTKFAMFAECGAVWLIGVPLAFFGALTLQLPIYLVYALIGSYNIVEAAILTQRFISKKWNKTMIVGLESEDIKLNEKRLS